MLAITRAMRAAMPLVEKNIGATVPTWQSGTAQLPANNYETYAREGYLKSELVFACIDALSTSAAEPRIVGMRGRGQAATIVYDHPLVDLLEAPNDFDDSFSMFETIIMHLELSGNAYLIKGRTNGGGLYDLWLVTRPDMMRPVPDAQAFIGRYDYRVGTEVIPIPTRDVIHFKLRNPLDRFLGVSPLVAASGRVDVDNAMRDFVKSFFMNAGVPAGLLSIKQKLTDGQKADVKGRFRQQFGGPRGWHDLLILDGGEASFTPMTMQMGQRGLVVPELDNIDEARICMVFGVPPGIVGAQIGMENSSYANMRMVQTFFWDNTLAPLYKRLGRALTRQLKDEREFRGIDSLEFDLGDVQALQEDADAAHARWRADYQAGLVPLEAAQTRIGLSAAERQGTYLVPQNMTPTQLDDLLNPPVPAAPVAPTEPTMPMPQPSMNGNGKAAMHA